MRRSVVRAGVVAAVIGLGGCDKGSAKEPADEPAAAPAADGIKYEETIDLATPAVTESVGLPATGKVEISIDLQHAKADLSKASGTIRVRCPKGCRLGDDVAKLMPKLKNARANAFVGDGLSFGHIDFDSFDIVVDVADGVARIAKWDVQSKDVALILDGTVTLGSSVSDSQAKLCLRFAPTPALQQRDPKTAAVLMTTGAQTSPRDGMFNIELVDRIGQLKKLARLCDGSAPAPAPTLAAGSGVAPAVGSAAPPVDTPPDPATEALIAATVRQRSPTTFDVDRAKLDKLLVDPTTFARGARMVPAVRDGKPSGFKLYAIRAGSLYARLGFVNGDTLTSVAGMSLVSVDQALEVYAKLRDVKPGQTVTATIERKGTPVTLTYTIR